MKKIFLLNFLLFQLLFMPFVARAQERVLIDGLNYILNDEYKTASVTFQFFEYGSDEIGRSDFYTGEIVIPETIMHEGVTYSVTSIGDYAFRCSTVTSVTIPNSVTSIGKTAFHL